MGESDGCTLDGLAEEAQLIEHVKERPASYEAPHHMVFVDEIE